MQPRSPPTNLITYRTDQKRKSKFDMERHFDYGDEDETDEQTF